jgi:hypothetical protein
MGFVIEGKDVVRAISAMLSLEVWYKGDECDEWLSLKVDGVVSTMSFQYLSIDSPPFSSSR